MSHSRPGPWVEQTSLKQRDAFEFLSGGLEMISLKSRMLNSIYHASLVL